jgi:spermidine/putrescine transport system permease protein
MTAPSTHPEQASRSAGPPVRPTDRLTAGLWATGVAVFLFIYLPLGVVVLYAFHDASIVAWPFQPFTFRWFGALAEDRALIASAVASLKLAMLATIIALGVGVPGAFVLDRLDFPGKAAFERLVLLPLILPGVITGVALLTFFSFIGLSLSSGFPLVPGWPVVLGHGAALTSVVVTQVYARLRRFDRVLEEASQDLYANEWTTFWQVTLPVIRSAVLGSALLVFTLSLDEIAVTFFLIGRQNTIPLQIWGLLRRGITPEVNAAATVIFLVSVGVIVVWARLMREEVRSEE